VGFFFGWGNPVDTEEVASLIKQMCLENETVLGTELGNAIRVRFPDLNLKLQFGGLRKFIQEYCAGQVVYVRAQGGDGVYAHSSRADSGVRPEPRPPAASTAWAALVDPNVHTQLAVDPASGALHVYADGEALPKDLIHVDKISLEEHRAMAKGFLPQTPAASRSSFEGALSEDAFWWKWMTAFRTLADREIFENWMKWRYARIIALFDERLRSAGLSDDVVAVAIGELRKSKQVKSVSTKGTASIAINRPRGVAGDLPNTRLGVPDNRLRELAHSAIDLMSDGEIRRIWLPIGALADALRRKN
jgi:hypothetical protein